MMSLLNDWAESERLTAVTPVNLDTHIDGVLVIQLAESQTALGDRR